MGVNHSQSEGITVEYPITRTAAEVMAVVPMYYRSVTVVTSLVMLVIMLGRVAF